MQEVQMQAIISLDEAAARCRCSAHGLTGMFLKTFTVRGVASLLLDDLVAFIIARTEEHGRRTTGLFAALQTWVFQLPSLLLSWLTSHGCGLDVLMFECQALFSSCHKMFPQTYRRTTLGMLYTSLSLKAGQLGSRFICQSRHF